MCIGWFIASQGVRQRSTLATGVPRPSAPAKERLKNNGGLPPSERGRKGYVKNRNCYVKKKSVERQ
jgi:hypothetical protein